jgi:hypothetical protein
LTIPAKCDAGENWVEIHLPLITVAESNGGVKTIRKFAGKTRYKSEHWTESNRRHKIQKGTVHVFLRQYAELVRYPCRITLTRFCAKKLDKFDNLPMSFKWILDAICEVLADDYRPGRADEILEDQIDVIYKQIISPDHGVVLRFDW